MSIPSKFATLHKLLYALNVNDNIILQKLSGFYDDFDAFLDEYDETISTKISSVIVSALPGSGSVLSSYALVVDGVQCSTTIDIPIDNDDFLTNMSISGKTLYVDRISGGIISAELSSLFSVNEANELSTLLTGQIESISSVVSANSEKLEELGIITGELSSAISSLNEDLSTVSSELVEIISESSGVIDGKINGLSTELSSVSGDLNTLISANIDKIAKLSTTTDLLSSEISSGLESTLTDAKAYTNEVSAYLNEALSTASGTIESDISSLSSGMSAIISSLSSEFKANESKVSSEIDYLSTTISENYESLSGLVSSTSATISSGLDTKITENAYGISYISGQIDSKLSAITGDISEYVNENVVEKYSLSSIVTGALSGAGLTIGTTNDNRISGALNIGLSSTTTTSGIVVSIIDTISNSQIGGNINLLNQQILSSAAYRKATSSDVDNSVSAVVEGQDILVLTFNVSGEPTNTYINISSLINSDELNSSVSNLSSQIFGDNGIITGIQKNSSNIEFLSSYISGFNGFTPGSSKITNALSTTLATEMAVTAYVNEQLANTGNEDHIITGYYVPETINGSTTISGAFYGERTKKSNIESTSSVLYEGLPSTITIESNDPILSGKYDIIDYVNDNNTILGANTTISCAWIKNDYSTTSSIIGILPTIFHQSNDENRYQKINIMIIELSGCGQLSTVNDLLSKLSTCYNRLGLSASYLTLSTDITSCNIDYPISTWFNCLDENGNMVTNFFTDDNKISGWAQGKELYLSAGFKSRHPSSYESLDCIDLLSSIDPISSDTYIKYYPGKIATDVATSGYASYDYSSPLSANANTIYVNVNDIDHIGSYIWLPGIDRYKCIYEEVRNVIVPPSTATISKEEVGEASYTAILNKINTFNSSLSGQQSE